jgi:hypothetical protein
MGGNPVYFTPPSTGLTIAGDFGRGLNNASGKANYFGGRLVLGLPMVTVGVGGGTLRSGGSGVTEFGGHAGVKVFGLPASGVSISVQAGLGYVKTGGITNLTIPAGVTLGFKPPSPGVSFEPWVNAGVRHLRQSGGAGPSASTTKMGASGGVNVGLPMGLGFHAALDYTNISGGSPFLVGAGVHYKISVPGLGGM